jgi:hypothetical protein
MLWNTDRNRNVVTLVFVEMARQHTPFSDYMDYRERTWRWETGLVPEVDERGDILGFLSLDDDLLGVTERMQYRPLDRFLIGMDWEDAEVDLQGGQADFLPEEPLRGDRFRRLDDQKVFAVVERREVVGDWVKLSVAARRLSCHPRTLHRWRESGHIGRADMVSMPGGHWIVSELALEELVRARSMVSGETVDARKDVRRKERP